MAEAVMLRSILTPTIYGYKGVEMVVRLST